jgi:hypothetical protein
MRLTLQVQRSLILPALAGLLLSCGGEGPVDPPDPVATKLAFVTAPPASASVSQVLSPQPVIQLQDATGTAVPKAGVVVTATLEGGTVPAGATATTTSSGRATFSGLALSAATGSRTLHFDAPGLTGLTHAVVLSAGATSVLSANSAASQTSAAGLPVAQLPSVKVADAAGNPAAGISVTFSVVAGNGELTDAVQQSAEDGVATVGAWALGLVPGTNSVRASAEGVAGSVTFTATGVLLGQATAQPPAVQVAVVGTEVGTAPSVTVVESGAPKAGALVRFRVMAGGGSVTVAEAATDAAGVASPGEWVLGAIAGENVLEVEVPGYSATAFRFRAWGVAQLPASLVLHAGNGQTADAGQVLPVAPAVRAQDAGGSPLVGFPVTFALADEASGTITGASAVTNVEGVATVGSWQLPLPNGVVHLEANAPTLGGTPVHFTATVFDDTPAQLEVVSGAITAQVATSVATLPRVRVRTIGGDLLAGVPVQFAVAGGGGSLTGATPVTNGAGEASPSSWTLGTVAGQQTVTAAAGAVTPITIAATATAGPPSAAVVVQGDNQTGPVYNPVLLDPAVRVEDQYGNPVSGAQVAYAVTLGGGRVIQTSQFSGTNGEARGRWTLGGTTGLNQLTANFPSLPIAPVQFSATATAVSSSFNIEVLYVGSPSAAEQAAVDAAVARWRTIVQGDIPDIEVTLAAATCTSSQPAINQVVDDVLIVVDFSNIDGLGGVLGSAGPCALRGSTFLPAFGTITIDGADATQLAASGELRDVMLHEMAHVLGFGTIWTYRNLLIGEGSGNPQYTGTAAKQAYYGLGGTQVNVPVEGTGGPGTADSHWRESVFANELMTGFIGGNNNPLSKVTSRSLLDLGYAIDDATADPLGFTLNVRRDAQAARARVPLRHLRERPLSGPIIVIYPDGTTRKVPR